MHPVLQKLRYIYLPFLAATGGFVASYSLLTWGLVHRWPLLPVDRSPLLFGLPLGLGLIPLLLSVAPRLELLDDAEPQSRLLLAVAGITMVASAREVQRGFLATPGSFAVALLLLTAGAVLFLVILLLSPDIQRARLHRHLHGSRREPREPAGWRRLLGPVRGRAGTLALAGTNVAVYLGMVLSGARVEGIDTFRLGDLVAWGATSRPLLQGGGVLRVFSSQFVHSGMGHLLFNLFGLVLAGTLLEPGIGGARVVAAYLVAGACGAIASALVHPSVVTVGASGAVLGLCALLFALVAARTWRDRSALPLLLPIGAFIGLNLLAGAGRQGVDNAVHLGGVLAGLLLAPLLGRAHLRSQRREP